MTNAPSSPRNRSRGPFLPSVPLRDAGLAALALTAGLAAQEVNDRSDAAMPPASVPVNTAPATPLPAMAPQIVWVDYDGDGLLDLFVAGGAGGYQLFRTGAGGLMDEVTERVGLHSGTTPVEVTWVDFDADGRVDLHEVHSDGSMRLMRNREDGRFEDVAKLVGFEPNMPVATSLWLDYDRNGHLDCQVVGQDGRLCILQGGKSNFVALNLKCSIPSQSGAQAVPTVVGQQGALASASQAAQGRATAPNRIAIPTASGTATSTSLPPGGPATASATTVIAQAMVDQASPPTNAISASTVPTMGMLFPMSTALNVSPTGVGVGVVGAAAKFHIRNQSNAVSRELFRIDDLNAAGNGGTEVRFVGDADSVTIANSWRDLHLGASASGSHAVKTMTISATGKVGIGAIYPNQRLSIAGGIGFANQNDVDKKLYSPTDGMLEWMTHDAAPAHGFAVSHQGTQRIVLDANGPSFLMNTNLGVGTRNPQAKFEVESQLPPGIADDLMVLDSDNSSLGAGASLLFKNQATNLARILAVDSGSQDGSLVFQSQRSQGGLQEAMRITSTGKVTIGNTAPTEAMNVDGIIRSTGGVRFPDGTLQATAQVQGPTGPVGPAGGVTIQFQGSQDPSVTNIAPQAIGRLWIDTNGSNDPQGWDVYMGVSTSHGSSGWVIIY